MYNSDHKSLHHRPPASPRISFSSDFVDLQQTRTAIPTAATSSPSPPVSSDFEFSVSNYSMMPADELFFEGRLLPFKDSHSHHHPFHRPTTLRDELLLEDEDEEEEDDDISRRPSKGRWKGFLGLKKSHNATKKGYQNDGSSGGSGGSDTVADGKRPFGWTTSHATKPNSSQLENEGGPSCKDVEIDF
ncbi:uncharacterized protein LOC111017947 [Momordica charantia]|uniref:Uncharacterized protein LOC111017947 n=1 Tax=Momordica charantia TaxID=3673 RepID=A0A6J1D890_MOMCH|nr:uncharacterized protein LOC111017947 [Momordica charantia]